MLEKPWFYIFLVLGGIFWYGVFEGIKSLVLG